MLQLSAGSQLRVQPGPARLSCAPRCVAPLGPLSAGPPPPYGELDVAALVVRVTAGSSGSQTAHLTDRAGHLLSAVCWPGLKVSGRTESGSREVLHSPVMPEVSSVRGPVGSWVVFSPVFVCYSVCISY